MTTSALPARYNFIMWQGATWEVTVTALTGDTGSASRDLTNWTAFMGIYTSGSTNPTFSLTSGNGITLGGAAGTIALYIDASDTSTFNWKTASYQLTLTDPTQSPAFVDPLLAGKIKIEHA